MNFKSSNMQDEIYDEESNTNIIEAAEADYLYILPSQIQGSGNGLFTAIKIYKDEIIAVFKGEILTDEQAQIRVQKHKDQYFINMLDGSIMDSKKTKCFAKYANDAKGFSISDFKNNARITLDENDNVCLIAIRAIKTGEEIFCSYGNKYWKKHGK